MDNFELANFSGLKLRLAALYALAAAVVIAGGFWYLGHFRAARLANAEGMLLSIAEIKLEQLRLWREDRLSDAGSLLDSPGLGQYLARFAADPADRAGAALLQKRLQAYIRHKKYPFAGLADGGGRVLVSTGLKPGAGCPQIEALVRRARASGRPEIGGFCRGAGDAAPHIDIAAPAAKSSRGKEIFLLLRVDPAVFLYPMLENWSAKGETGEIFLAAGEDGEVVYLNDLRHAKGSALNLRLPIDTAGLPAALAIKGGSGVVRGRDYRGVEVLAAFTPVPGTNWALVAKLDWAELMAGTGTVGGLLLALVLALLASAGGSAYLLLSRQEREYWRAYAWMKSSYELFNEKANDGILVADLGSGRVLEANGRACSMYGYRPGEMNGLELSSLVPGKDREAFEARLREDLPAGSRVYEAGHRRRDGGVFPAEVSVSVVESSGRKLMFAIVRDISERKLAEAKLRVLAQQRQLALDAACMGWWSYVPVSRIATYDDGYKKIFEVEDYSRPNDEILKRLHPDDLPGVWAKVEAALDPVNPQPYAAEYRILIPGGPVKWVEAHGIAVFEGEGKDRRAVELVGTVADITARKRAEEAIGRLNRDLVEKNSEMENFLYITTHDLRSPLVNIQGFSRNLQGYVRELGELAARAALPDAEMARVKELSGGNIPEALGFVLESSRKMDVLITALLKVSRAGRLELKPETLEMNGLIERLLGAMHYQLLESGAEVKLGELPPCLADAGAVSQLFSNLLDNAVKYRDPARPLVVEISGKAEGEKALYTVADNGPAIKETDLPRLWDLFYKPAGRNRGEGIGLPMVKKMAERSGGGIRAELRPGGGMLFRVELPRGGEDL